MRIYLTSAFAAALLIGAPLTFTGCETETQREVESDGDVDYDTELGVDEAAVDEIQTDAEVIGNEVEEGAREVGDNIEDAAQDAGDAIDRNVDLGENAENQ
ncbi:hypothetical protein RQM47_10940 [Rubrivirga sp. S365]|uniref:Uncharacterized protein n=1 Tax=Rubrivirga litoralis TaxID=3075598 RepID=A0ABU3BTQ2_9BACT|nr:MULTISPECIES: hypothetical protein [unclassified Rubrivirga]MDT0632667.1 hypothetical protein [Rubrivirga sp. F394]MDT7857156.1 hypothetical protein [Rubrivirga sp. S365]